MRGRIRMRYRRPIGISYSPPVLIAWPRARALGVGVPACETRPRIRTHHPPVRWDAARKVLADANFRDEKGKGRATTSLGAAVRTVQALDLINI
jgi:hypothetical protein